MKEDFVMIQALVKRGVYQRDIATMLGVHPKTVGRALAREGAPDGPAKRGSLLDPYKERIDGLLHHATTVNIKGDSYRLREKRKAGLLGRRPAPAPEEEPAEVT